MGSENSKKENKNIAIKLEKDTFYPGETVSGVIECSITELITINDIKINLTKYEGFSQRVKRGKNKHTINRNNNTIILQNLLKIKEYLKINSLLITLNEGNYVFPFNFILPNIISPSFNYYFYDGKGYNYYKIIIELDLPYGTKTNINIQQEKIINILLYSEPIEKPLFYSQENSVYKWGFINQGKIILSAFYPKNYYIYNENIPIKITIDNTCCGMEVVCINIQLMRKITFVANYWENLYHFDIIDQKEFNPNIKSGETILFNENLVIQKDDSEKEIIKGKKNENLPCLSLELIKCEYYIEISLVYESMTFSGSKPKLILPIFVGHNFKEKNNNNDNQNVNEVKELKNNIDNNKDNKKMEINVKENNNINETATPYDMFEAPPINDNIININNNNIEFVSKNNNLENNNNALTNNNNTNTNNNIIDINNINNENKDNNNNITNDNLNKNNQGKDKAKSENEIKKKEDNNSFIDINSISQYIK